MGTLFKDKVVIVTGSGQGIGRAIAIAFGAEGARVVTNNRKPGSTGYIVLPPELHDALPAEKRREFDGIIDEIKGDAESTARTIIEAGGLATPVYGDLAIEEDCKKIVDAAAKAYGTVDIVINVAGAFGGGALEEMSLADWDRVCNVKPRGYFSVVKYAVPYMVEKGWGRIINSTSKAFMGDIVKMANYCTANAGSVGLTQALACEFFADGITANAFAPFARTRASYGGDYIGAMGDSVSGEDDFPKAADTPDPEALCPFIEYLCTDAAKDVTGTVFTLAGNQVLMHQFPIIAKSITKAGSDYWTVEELAQIAPGTLFRGYNNITAYQ
ncbi:MAG: SDR family oxidoreductase [Coriobacteriales bacterium]|jgi:3-oxoacyl-[acyl-carrier protein] reductase|nr:SDR family oxidoreductase [Coriobacteriales bacterium]